LREGGIPLATITQTFNGSYVSPFNLSGWYNSGGNFYSTNGGNHGSGSNGYIRFTMPGDGTVTAWFGVSSERNYDYMTVYFNGSQVWRQSGGYSSSYSRSYKKGDSVEIRGYYSKDGSVNTGSDRGYFSQVRIVYDDNSPTISNFTASPSSFHRQSVRVTANLGKTNSDVLSARYKLSVGSTILKDWTSYTNLPFNIDDTFEYTDFPNLGNNTIKLEVQSNESDNISDTYNVSKTYNNPSITLTADRTTIHNEDVVITSRITDADSDDKVSYKIDLDGVVFQNWTTFAEPPTDIEFTFENKYFDVGTNVIKITAKDDYTGSEVTKTITITKTNVAPSIKIVEINSPVHKENVKVSFKIEDPENDFTKYRISLEGTELNSWTMLSDYSSLMSIAIDNTKLKEGENTLTFQLEDSFGGTKTENITIVKENNKPTIVIDYFKGYTMRFTVNDIDGDEVAFKIVINGQPYIPREGFGAFFKVPYSVEINIDPNAVVRDELNTITIEVKDDIGRTNFENITTVFSYAGLVFCDVNETLYTNDIGYILKTLNHGLLVAGNASDWIEVWVKNYLGYDVNNVLLRTVQGALDPEHEIVQLASDINNPPLDGLNLGTIKSGEKKSFFVRVNADRQAITGGRFFVNLYADPL
jgi:hypothetical protein